ncbi:hypothetical protein FJQ98_14170 [Lysinibacillus agricola]|uniref:Uncharacterized protein n=1 Tax=Lysinibacillus agricola TaxID=2590012 RepID=A0ABX7AL02_9BACI|nr:MULTISPECIES: hypothetical protein [Lysinibacillus]KOS64706.1 hypothetical protein AN161_01030 [Lysinibacillus sp. FJAT-14222]QQP10434.1 hypothetical protein FJQ98_14170 [Lysinibacillus agricola]
MKTRTNVPFECEENSLLLLQHEIELTENINESKEKYRKIVQAGIAQWIKDFQSGHIKVNTVDDLKKLIELDIDLQKDEI